MALIATHAPWLDFRYAFWSACPTGVAVRGADQLGLREPRWRT
jgi:hypothetical protein